MNAGKPKWIEELEVKIKENSFVTPSSHLNTKAIIEFIAQTIEEETKRAIVMHEQIKNTCVKCGAIWEYIHDCKVTEKKIKEMEDRYDGEKKRWENSLKPWYKRFF
jgi:hypothetical protein